MPEDNSLTATRKTCIACRQEFWTNTGTCPSCGEQVIERDWYVLGRYRVTGDGHCNLCGARIAGRFDGPPGEWGARRVPVFIGDPEVR